MKNLRKKTKITICHLFDKKSYVVWVDENEKLKWACGPMPHVWKRATISHFLHSLLYISLHFTLFSLLLFFLSLLCVSQHACAFPSPPFLVLLNWLSLCNFFLTLLDFRRLWRRWVQDPWGVAVRGRPCSWTWTSCHH